MCVSRAVRGPVVCTGGCGAEVGNPSRTASGVSVWQDGPGNLLGNVEEKGFQERHWQSSTRSSGINWLPGCFEEVVPKHRIFFRDDYRKQKQIHGNASGAADCALESGHKITFMIPPTLFPVILQACCHCPESHKIVACFLLMHFYLMETHFLQFPWLQY